MFDLLDRPLVWIPVKFRGLKQEDESGLAVSVEYEVEVQVEIVDRDEFRRLFQPEEGTPKLDEMAIATRVVHGWRKVRAGGRPLDFNSDNLAKMLRVPNFALALELAYLEAFQGKAKVREGNSEGSQPGGRADEQATGTSTNLNGIAPASA